MLHSANLAADPYLPYNPYATSTATSPFANPDHHHHHPHHHHQHPHLMANGPACCSPHSLSPASSAAAVAALTAAVAVSTGIAPPPIVKDSRWLTLEVCRQYQRNQCARDENECKFAHPPTHVDVQNGRVICCYDSIKGKCQRRDPPCKYLHPPQHLREQLMQNGRSNMIIRNMQLQLIQQQLIAQTTGILPFGSAPTVTVSSSSMVNGNSSPNSILYPAPGPLALNASNAYSFLNMGFAPYLAAITGSTLNGATGLPELMPPEPSSLIPKRSISDLKGSTLYVPRSNGTNRTNGTGERSGKLDVSEPTTPCLMVVNGSAGAEPIKESVRTTAGNQGQSNMAPATLYAIQPPAAAAAAVAATQQGASLLHVPASQTQAITPFTAASLAAVVNGTMPNGAGAHLASGHFPALTEHTAYYQPTYHIEIPPYPYQ